jgi:hypothetical protein
MTKPELQDTGAALQPQHDLSARRGLPMLVGFYSIVINAVFITFWQLDLAMRISRTNWITTNVRPGPKQI